MAITIQNMWRYENGTSTSIPTVNGIDYTSAGYSYGYYVTVLKCYTDTSIQAPKIRCMVIYDNTNSSKYLGAYFVKCGQNDSPSATLTANSNALASYYQTRIRFGYDWTGTFSSGSWGSYNSTNWGSGTCSTDVKIPKGYFFIYIGSGTGATSNYSNFYGKTANTSVACQITATALSQYTISYNVNGGSGSAPTSQKKDWGVNITLSSTKIPRSATTANGYTVSFNGNGGSSPSSVTAINTTTYNNTKWNTNSGGTGTDYNRGATYSANANATMYAKWSSSTTKGSITLPSSSRTYFDFLGWSTSSTATSASYLGGASYTPSSTHTLYAVWRRSKVTITFNTDGGTMADNTWDVDAGVSMTLPTADQCTKNGATLLGWDTNVLAASPAYAPGSSFTPTANITLYAFWQVGDKIYIKVNNQWKLSDKIFIKQNGQWLGG